MEFWRPIQYFLAYDVSNYGRVRNTKTKRVLNLTIDDRGNVQVQLRKNGRSHTLKVRRLVALAFLDLPENYEELDVGCIDGDKTNLYVDNLVWRSRSEAAKHAFINGTRISPTATPVRIVETGEEFASIKECANAIGASTNTVSYWLDNPGHSIKGWHIVRI